MAAAGRPRYRKRKHGAAEGGKIPGRFGRGQGAGGWPGPQRGRGGAALGRSPASNPRNADYQLAFQNPLNEYPSTCVHVTRPPGTARFTGAPRYTARMP